MSRFLESRSLAGRAGLLDNSITGDSPVGKRVPFD